MKGRIHTRAENRVVAIVVASALLIGVFSAIAWKQEPDGSPFGQEPTSWPSMEWFRAPREENRFLRQPAIAAALSSVAFVDAQRGWAVGAQGTVIATRDGGRTWQEQTACTECKETQLYEVTFLADGQRGWAVGSEGTVMFTRDGGKNWKKQKSPAEEYLYGVTFAADGLRGWAVGEEGIMTTRNGGREWKTKSVRNKSGVALYGIAFTADGKRGWAVGEGGTVIAMGDEDEGVPAKHQDSQVTVTLKHVAVAKDGVRAWAVGDEGTVIATRDGGATWEQQEVTDCKESLERVAFQPDGQRGWAVGDKGIVIATHDGGLHWEKQTTGTNAMINGVSFAADNLRGIAVGDDGTVITTDDGTTWTAQTGGSKAWLFGVSFAAGGQSGWAVGGEGVVLATHDGGRTWQTQESHTDATFFDVTFAKDGQRGWAVGERGTMLTTRDGGKNWTVQERKDIDPIGITFTADGQQGWAVGERGTLVATRDGGKNWTTQKLDLDADIFSITFAEDALRGWAVGSSGALFTTPDGGHSWERQAFVTKENLTDVAFAEDKRRGWAVGMNGTVLATVDGGLTWKVQAIDTEADLTSVTIAADGQRGWIVGDKETILSTADGGRTWNLRKGADGAPPLTAVTFEPGGQRGWTVGYGTVLSTGDGGASWTPLQYARSPAPWYYASWPLVLMLAALLIWFATKKPATLFPKIYAIPDEPIRSIEDDRLQHQKLAEGLACYLRNDATRPPLVIAINAPWGSGKSSLMNLLRGLLSRHGVQSVWFNAWHHQHAPILTAPLLEAIRKQALPPLFSLYGLRFRARLLFFRASRAPLLAAVTLLSLVLPLFYFAAAAVQVPLDSSGSSDTSFVASVYLTFSQLWDRALAFGPVQTLFHDGLFAFLGASARAMFLDASGLMTTAMVCSLCLGLFATGMWGMRAFPESPAVLLSALDERFKRSEAEAVNSFRDRFQRHFGDVCAALDPFTLTIYIDDLDRCSPAKCAEMLEVINYLTSSGRCFIVLGLAVNVVEAQISQHYQTTADAYTKLSQPNVATTDAQLADGRADYVRDYLQKLINLEIRIPSLGLPQVERLVIDESTPPAKIRLKRDALLRTCRRWGPRLLVSGLMAGVLFMLPQVVNGVHEGRDRLVQHRLQQTEDMDMKLADLVAKKHDLGAQLDVAPKPEASTPTRHETHRRRARDSASPTVSEKAAHDTAERRREMETSLASMSSVVQRAQAARATYNRSAFELAYAEGIALSAPRDVAGHLGEVGSASTEDPQANPKSDSSHHADSSGLVHHSARTLKWPYYLAGLVVLLLLPFAISRLLTADFVVHDDPEFQHALKIWQGALMLDDKHVSPRDVKRFMNKARYFASRLREPTTAKNKPKGLDESEERSKPENKDGVVDESVIVALSALHHLGHRFVLQVCKEDEERRRLDPLWSKLAALVEQHESKEGFEKIEATDCETFLAAIGEYNIPSETLENDLPLGQSGTTNVGSVRDEHMALSSGGVA